MQHVQLSHINSNFVISLRIENYADIDTYNMNTALILRENFIF